MFTVLTFNVDGVYMSPEEPARYHHGDLRRTLVDVSRRLIEDDGLARLSLRAVARAAGVSHAAPYRHFEDRRALLAAVAAQGFAELAAAMAPSPGCSPDVDAVLRSTGAGYVRFAVDNPQLFRLMFGAELADKSELPELDVAADAAFTGLVAALEVARQAGVVRADEPETLALLAWSTVHGLAFLALDQQLGKLGVEDEAIEAMVERVLKLSRHGTAGPRDA